MFPILGTGLQADNLQYHCQHETPSIEQTVHNQDFQVAVMNFAHDRQQEGESFV